MQWMMSGSEQKEQLGIIFFRLLLLSELRHYHIIIERVWL